MSKGYDLSGYVDVATRIAQFSEKYPDGSLQSDLTFTEGGWLCKARAYRTPDDPRPGHGHAFEPVPGKTPYTKDSEAMNAETSAWGRAIVALGFETKHIASSEEVQARQVEVRKEGGLGEAPVPKNWGQLEKWYTEHGGPGALELSREMAKAYLVHQHGTEDKAALTKEERDVLWQKAAGAQVWLAENGDNVVGPLPPSVELYTRAWAHVLGGHVLEGIEWTPPEDEAEALAEEVFQG